MTPAELSDFSLPASTEGFDGIEMLYQPGDTPVRDDLSLCFLCLRWTSGDHDCRSGIRCKYQLMLDDLEAQP
jgi:hypothetical protein